MSGDDDRLIKFIIETRELLTKYLPEWNLFQNGEEVFNIKTFFSKDNN